MQIVLAVLGMYAGFFGLYKIKSALSAKPVPAPAKPLSATAASASSSPYGFTFPTEENFDEWDKNPANWAAFESWVNSPKFDQWAEGK